MKHLFLSIGALVMLLASAGSGFGEVTGSPTDRAVLKAVVHSAAAGLGAVAVNKDGTHNDALIKNYVDAVRFFDDKTGYFFVFDYRNNVCIAHAALKDFPGKNHSSYKDSRGTFVIQELSKTAKNSGSGFLVYFWDNPETHKEERKLSYVEVIPGTTLYIGAGIYLP